MNRATLVICICTVLSGCFGGDRLSRQVEDISRRLDATAGVAMINREGRIFTFNDTVEYPLMSVFKLHVVTALLSRMEDDGKDTGSVVSISKEQMHENTYSPLRDRFPDRDFEITTDELIRYAIAESDNNACDILIGMAGGIDSVDAFIKGLGITGCSLSETEYSMHEDIMRSYNNWSHPSSAVMLLKMIADGKVLTEKHTDYLMGVMEGTRTGTEKIRSGLPEGITAGNKTGSSDRLADGTKQGDNDLAFIRMPDGRYIFLAVFIKDSKESDSTNAAAIASIARAAYGSVMPTTLRQ